MTTSKQQSPQILNQLQNLRDSRNYPFHMPGHKRNTDMFCMENPYGLDITEIDGFDNLHDAGGLLKEAMNRAAMIYQSEETHFLVNGSTGGILSGILGAAHEGDKILMMRNCHKSVYNAVLLNHLDAEYLYPEVIPDYGISGSVTAAEVEKKIAQMDSLPKLIVLVSPTYEGIVSDVKGIVEAAHGLGIPVLVDEAHGAHFGFHSCFPTGSVRAGADIVVQSLHKTMPCFTQTALIHLQGTLADRERIRQYLAMLQTSSPSYLFMASIDQCMSMLQTQGKNLFEQYAERLQGFYEQMERLEYLKVMGAREQKYRNPEYRDISKILIYTGNGKSNGVFINNCLLTKYHLQMEMACENYVLAMTSIGDTDKGLRRLGEALQDIEETEAKTALEEIVPEQDGSPRQMQKKMPVWQAFEQKKRPLPLEAAEGALAGDYVYPYPPGIPLLVPGEMIDRNIIRRIKKMVLAGLDVKGVAVQSGTVMVRVIDGI